MPEKPAPTITVSTVPGSGWALVVLTLDILVPPGGVMDGEQKPPSLQKIGQLIEVTLLTP
jgi:hypothetical protein